MSGNVSGISSAGKTGCCSSQQQQERQLPLTLEGDQIRAKENQRRKRPSKPFTSATPDVRECKSNLLTKPTDGRSSENWLSHSTQLLDKSGLFGSLLVSLSPSHLTHSRNITRCSCNESVPLCGCSLSLPSSFTSTSHPPLHDLAVEPLSECSSVTKRKSG